MSSQNPSRVHAGVPRGGQFAAQSHAEPVVSLGMAEQVQSDSRGACDTVDDALESQEVWGRAGVKSGSRTPWGTADYARDVAPGIASVSTAGHGGIKLSPERNKAIPPALRNRSGWYEEDCEAAIPMYYHANAFCDTGDSVSDLKDQAYGSMCNWFPDQVGEATGNPVPEYMSTVLQDRRKAADGAAFRAAHADEFVSTGWGTDSNGEWVPDGYTVLSARVDATGEERDYLIPKSEAISDHMVRDNVVVDPHRHIDVTGIGTLGNPPPRPVGPTLHGDQLGVDYSHLTEAQARRAGEELDRRYRFRDSDGTEHIETMVENLARIGLTGKRTVAYGNQDKVSYVIDHPGDRIQPLSKAAYDALAGVPDITTDHERAAVTRMRAEHRLRRAESDFDMAKIRVERENVAKASAAANAAFEEEHAADIPWTQRQQMRKDALNDLLAERGIELD